MSAAPIRPEIIAAKVQAIGDATTGDELLRQAAATPRLRELLWFLQWQSLQPGGLPRFCQGFVDRADEAGRLGTKTMLALAAKGGEYSQKQRDAIFSELPHYAQKHLENQPHGPGRERMAADLLTRDFARTFARDCALEALPGRLAEFCNDAHSPLRAPWCCHGLLAALVEEMDAHARTVAANFAHTDISRKIWDALDYSAKARALVRIEGDTRFGKTEAIKTWAAMRPGRARLVTVPCSNNDADFFRAIAEALGIAFDYATPTREIKAKVEDVVRQGGIAFIFDEAHFLLPARYSKDTPPMRLNWLRTRLADYRVPVVLVTTPQAFKHAAGRFVKATGHNFDQFLGRVALTVNLPAELEEKDLLAVVRAHAPEWCSDFQELVVAAALRSESYLKAVESIAQRARYVAERDGHSAVTLADLDVAIGEVIGAAPAAPAPQTPRRTAQPAPPAGRAVTPAASAPARVTRPVENLEPSLDS